jgi:hypothetical protein
MASKVTLKTLTLKMATAKNRKPSTFNAAYSETGSYTFNITVGTKITLGK